MRRGFFFFRASLYSAHYSALIVLSKKNLALAQCSPGATLSATGTLQQESLIPLYNLTQNDELKETADII